MCCTAFQDHPMGASELVPGTRGSPSHYQTLTYLRLVSANSWPTMISSCKMPTEVWRSWTDRRLAPHTVDLSQPQRLPGPADECLRYVGPPWHRNRARSGRTRQVKPSPRRESGRLRAGLDHILADIGQNWPGVGQHRTAFGRRLKPGPCQSEGQIWPQMSAKFVSPRATERQPSWNASRGTPSTSLLLPCHV